MMKTKMGGIKIIPTTFYKFPAKEVRKLKTVKLLTPSIKVYDGKIQLLIITHKNEKNRLFFISIIYFILFFSFRINIRLILLKLSLIFSLKDSGYLFKPVVSII